MRSLKLALVVLSSIASCCCALHTPFDHISQHIEPATIRISVTCPDGPVEGVVFGVYDECNGSLPPPQVLVKGTTDSAGVATINWPRCSKNMVEIIAVPRQGTNPVTSLPYDLGDEQRRLSELGLGGVDIRLEIPNDQNEIQISLTAPGTLTAQVRIVAAVPMAEAAIRLQSTELLKPFRLSPQGDGKISGIRKGEPIVGHLVVSPRSSAAAQVIPVNFAAAQADVNLGEIQIPTIVPNAHVDIRASISRENEPKQMWTHVCEDAVTLVSSDGDTILIGDAFRKSDGAGFSHLHIPAGTYFVVPGTFHAGGAHRRLLDRIQASEDLTNSGIPKFTVAAGETATLEYAWVDAWRAIFQTP